MKKIIIISIIIAAGLYGNHVYSNKKTIPFSNPLTQFESTTQRTPNQRTPNGYSPDILHSMYKYLKLTIWKIRIFFSNLIHRNMSTSKGMNTESQVKSNSETSTTNARFKCDGRTRCSQMTSCEEATFFINNCPGVQMDGNNDGVPCEKQWCN